MLLIYCSHLILSFLLYLHWGCMCCCNAWVRASVILSSDARGVLHFPFLVDIKLLMILIMLATVAILLSWRCFVWSMWCIWEALSWLLTCVKPLHCTRVLGTLRTHGVALACESLIRWAWRCGFHVCRVSIRQSSQSAMLLLKWLHWLNLSIYSGLIGAPSPRYACISVHLERCDGLFVLVDWIHHELIDLSIDEDVGSILANGIRGVVVVMSPSMSSISWGSKVRVWVMIILDLLVWWLLIRLTVLRIWMVGIVWTRVVWIVWPNITDIV